MTAIFSTIPDSLISRVMISVKLSLSKNLKIQKWFNKTLIDLEYG